MKKSKVVYKKGAPTNPAKIKKEYLKQYEKARDLGRVSQPTTFGINHYIKSFFWFVTGFVFATLIASSFVAIYFTNYYQNRVIPGIFADNTYIGDKTKLQIRKIFDDKNNIIGRSTFTFSYGSQVATLSAESLGVGYNSKLIADQSMDLGKSPSIFSNMYIFINSYLYGTHLHASYTYNTQAVKNFVNPIQKTIYKEPIDAQFQVVNNRVTAFVESTNGMSVDFEELQNILQEKIREVVYASSRQNITIKIPVKTLTPKLTTDKANSFGIVEPLGTGTSFFAHSIPSRIHNVVLAASRVNGVLVAPDEEFSFDKYLGDVSSLTGYQQAYVIQNGHTVLGDGGGVCQVSTTLFRAILNSGLPVTQRHAHSYRVEYYEEGGFPPGIDATVYYPSVDLKFKNDTGNYILIQSTVDLNNLELTYTFYGKSDGRQVSMTTPIVTNQTPAPPPLYQDDPTLPSGQIKQTDFAAAGATATFHRTVTKNGKVIINDTYVSNYSPWQAVFLRGTKT